MKALSTSNEEPTKASRPFDAKRDGFVPAEIPGILIMETLEHELTRGSNIRCEVTGYEVSSDAVHMVQPDDEGSGDGAGLWPGLSRMPTFRRTSSTT